MKEVTFIGACFPPNTLNQLIEKKQIKDIAANVFGWKIVSSLVENDILVNVINEWKIDYFHKNRILLIKERRERNDLINLYTYSYFNLPLIKKIYKIIKIYQELKKIKAEKIIVYSMHTPYLFPAILYSKIENKKVFLFVPDLPQYMFSNYKGFFKLLKNIDLKILEILRKHVFKYILLTEKMAKELNIKEERYIVIEGICDEQNNEINFTNSDKKYIFYSGVISKEYGLKNFIDEYLKSKIAEEFWLCGEGNFVDEIKKVAKKYPKIKYLGLVNRVDLLKLQKNASLLINPRSKKDTYTDFSFPSKTMEYLASGTPVMMEKLNGIPKEYYNYIVEVKEGEWCIEIQNFFKRTLEDRKRIGKLGQLFVLNEKNIKKQGEKIFDFIKE